MSRLYWYLKDDEGLTVVSGVGPERAAKREGNHYLMVYSQDGPHKLTFRKAKRAKRKETP